VIGAQEKFAKSLCGRDLGSSLVRAANLLQVNVQGVHIAEIGADGGKVGTVRRKAFKAAAYGVGLKKRLAEIKNAINFLAALIPAKDCFLGIQQILKIETAAVRSPLIAAQMPCCR